MLGEINLPDRLSLCHDVGGPMTVIRRSLRIRRSSALLRILLAMILAESVGCSTSSDRTSNGATATSTAQAPAATPFKPADDATIDARARETEAKMTDDERFALLVSLIGAIPSMGVPRDPRIPENVTNMS